MYIEKETAYARRQGGSPGLTKLKSCFFIMLYYAPNNHIPCMYRTGKRFQL